MRFLIDECLSTALVKIANDPGPEAYHVAWRGLGGKSDSQLLREVVDHNLILVTNNRDDFVDLVGNVELHPGLIVILPNVPLSVADMKPELFAEPECTEQQRLAEALLQPAYPVSAHDLLDFGGFVPPNSSRPSAMK